jgi:hypothetical protein
VVPDQALTGIVEPGQLDDAARAAYAKAFDARRDTTGGLGDMEACLAAAKLFDVKVGGETVLRYALQQVNWPHGVEVCIVGAAGSLPGVDLVRAFLPYIENQCRTADCLTVQTQRRGVVKKLRAQGWETTYIMRKKIK